MPDSIPDKHHKFILIFFILVTLESLIVAIYLASLPGDPKNSLLLGFSGQRLILIGTMLAAFLVTGFFVIRRKSAWLARVASGSLYLPVLIASIIGFLIGFIFTQSPASLIDPTYVAYFERLYPILMWIWVVSLETILFISWLRFGWVRTLSSSHKATLVVSGVCGFVFILVTVFILLTRFGLRQDTEGWRKMGSPLLAWQIGLALVLAILLLVIDNQKWKATRLKSQVFLDAGLIILLYGLACTLWLPQPLQNSYFSPEVRPPNHEVYPYSDALYYGVAAETVTIGTGLYGGEVTPRPFYLAILSYITAAAKGDYAGIINIQTFLLALIPVFLHLVGKELMGRPLGFAVGLLGVFRELNAILSTRYIELSNSKMILADLPALLAILVCTWLLIRWWKGHRDSSLWALGIGGILGWVMLFRTQSVLLLGIVLLYLVLNAPRKWKSWLSRFGLVCAGLLLMILPWLIRNLAITGRILFDDPATQTQFLQQRLGMDVRDPNLNGSFLQLAVRNPGAILSYTTNHFLRNEIATLFVTPPQRFVETVGTVMTEYPFWRDDHISLSTGQAIQLALILGLMALGTGALFTRLRWAGLIPLAVNLAYTLSNALARNSSGRYNLPVDWVGYLYLMAGLIQIGWWVLQGFRLLPVKQVDKEDEKQSPLLVNTSMRSMLLLAMSLLLIGGLIPITERVFPTRYETLSRSDLVNLLQRWNVDPNAAKELLADPQVTYLYGRELYPRFYKPDIGEMGSTWVAYAPLDFCRMGFIMTGPAGVDQVLVTLDRPPKTFPNRVDTLVLGRTTSALVRGKPVEYLQAEMIIQPGNPPVVIEGLKEAPERCRLQ